MTKMTKKQNSLLNTALRSPIRFENTPRNSIPSQRISPLETKRVTFGPQHLSVYPVALQHTRFQATAGQVLKTSGQALNKQLFQRIPRQKQQVGTGTYLHTVPMYTKDKNVSFSFIHDAKRGAACVSNKHGSSVNSTQMPLLAECRLPMQGQQVVLRPIKATQYPVMMRLSHVQHATHKTQN